MAWTSSKISYLDGVSFAINPLFVPADQDDDEIEELFYDLDKANSILSCQPEFSTEKRILFQNDDDDNDDDYIEQTTDIPSSNDVNLQRPKSSSFTKETEKSQISILKLLSDFKSPLAFQPAFALNGVDPTLPNATAAEVKFSLGSSHSPTQHLQLSSSLPPVSPPTPHNYSNPQIAGINFNVVQSLKNNRSTDNLETMSKSPRIENETVKPVPVIAATATIPLVPSIPKLPNSSFNSILEPLRPAAASTNTITGNHQRNEFLSKSSSQATTDNRQDRSRATKTSQDTTKNGVPTLDIFSETTSSDPFNDMELKSINDIEELKNILSQHQHQMQQLESAAALEPRKQETTINDENQQQQQQVQSQENNIMMDIDSMELKSNKHVPTTTTIVTPTLATSTPTTNNSMIRPPPPPPPHVNSTTTTVASLPCAVDNYGLPNIKFNDLDF